MPKFIIWVLIVPFSWFFVQFLLSVSAVLTVGILTLPHDSFSDKPLYSAALDGTELAGEEICADMIISFNGEFPEWAGSLTEWTADDELDEYVKCAEDGKVTIKEILVGREDGSSTWLENSVFGIISIYSYGILKIDKLDSVFQADLESIETIADLIFKIVFDILFIAVYLLLMIALLLALFVRWVRLWIYAMLSPVFGLLYFFWKWSEWFWESGKSFNIKEFIALALVPVYVSAALAFGLVFILVAGEWIKGMNPEEDKLSAGWFSLTITWAHWDGESEKSVIWKLIVQIFWVVILWIAVMAALWASNTTKAIVEPIAQFGKSVWDLAAKAPTYAPIIPGPWWTMQSAASLKTIWWQFQSAASAEQTRRAQSFMEWSWLWDGPNWISKLNTEAEIASDRIKKLWQSDDYKWTANELRKLLREQWGDTTKIRKSKQTQDAIISAAAALDMTEINWVKLSDVRFNNDKDVVNALAEIDKVGGETKWASVFDWTFGKGELDIDTYNNWVRTWTMKKEDNTPPSATTPPTNTTININRNMAEFDNTWTAPALTKWTDEIKTALSTLSDETQKRAELSKYFNKDEVDAIIKAIT